MNQYRATSNASYETDTNFRVTSSSSSTGTDNPENVQEIADEISQSVAENNANIITQALTIYQSRIYPPTNTAYFNTMHDLDSFQLPMSNGPAYYTIFTNIPNYSIVNPDAPKTNASLLCLDSSERYIFTACNGTGNIGEISYYYITCYDLQESMYIQLPIQLPNSSSTYPDNNISSMIFHNNILYIGLYSSSICTLAYLDFSNPSNLPDWNLSSMTNTYYTNPIIVLCINNNTLYIGGDDSGSPAYGLIAYIHLDSSTFYPMNSINFSEQGSIVSIVFDKDNNCYAGGSTINSDRTYPVYIIKNNVPQILFNFDNIITNLLYNDLKNMLYISTFEKNLKISYFIYSFPLSSQQTKPTPLLKNVFNPQFYNNSLYFVLNYQYICKYNTINETISIFPQNPNDGSPNSSISYITYFLINSKYKMYNTFCYNNPSSITQTDLLSIKNIDSTPLFLENTNVPYLPQSFQTNLRFNTTTKLWEVI